MSELPLAGRIEPGECFTLVPFSYSFHAIIHSHENAGGGGRLPPDELASHNVRMLIPSNVIARNHSVPRKKYTETIWALNTGSL